MEKDEIEPYYQLRAKEIVDALFDKNYFAEGIKREDMQAVEDLIAYNFQSFAESNLRMIRFNKLKESKAELCIWCGKTYEEHRNEPLPSGAVPKMPCIGLKQYFVKKGKNGAN